MKNKSMHDRNQGNQDSLPGDLTGKDHGRQGVDKAPGEETAQDTQNVISDTQKGKNKIDGDPSKESDQPIDQERH